MKLEINKKHKRADLTRIISSIMASSLAITFLTGAANPKSVNKPDLNNPVIEDTVLNENEETLIFDFDDYEKIEIDETEKKEVINRVRENNAVKVPYILRKYIIGNDDPTEPITIKQLEKITDLELDCIYITNKDNLIWLNYCTNLKNLTLIVSTDEILEYIYDLPNLENLSIRNTGRANITLDKNNAKMFLSPNLKSLKLSQINIEENILNNLSQIETLDISDIIDPLLINYDIDYSQLSNLNKLIISNPYSVAIRLDTHELETLLNNGVKIVDKDGNDLSEELNSINKIIDEIIKTLDIKEKDSEEQRLQKLLMYVLENLNYDEELLKSDSFKRYDKTYTQSFYTQGYLYGALKMDTSICGNYSALVSTLSERLGINSLVLISRTHAWNLIQLEGKYYYVDATLMDNELSPNISFNKVINNSWYLQDPNGENDINHRQLNLPDLIKINPVPTTSGYIDNYNVNMNGKNYIVPATVLVGILSAFGLAYEAKLDYNINKTNEELEDEIKKGL